MRHVMSFLLRSVNLLLERARALRNIVLWNIKFVYRHKRFKRVDGRIVLSPRVKSKRPPVPPRPEPIRVPAPLPGDKPPVMEILTFPNITIVPSTAIYGYPDRIANGGPLYPDFENLARIRYCVGGTPRDELPPPPTSEPEVVDEDFIMGFYARPQFGHLIQDNLSRLVVARARFPDLKALFITDPVYRPTGAHDSLYEICDWFGIGRQDIRFVTQPIIVRTLHVAANVEASFSEPPTRAYLRLLSANQARNRLVPVESTVLYVTRAGMLGKFRGGHPGEGYFVTLLAKAGVTVMDPAQVPLREQLRHYAGAKTIVFAEGSALHGRQLLGWLDQEIVIINRRPTRRMAVRSMRARCKRVSYVEATVNTISPIETSGRERGDAAISILDTQMLRDEFKRLGVDLSDTWDDAAFSEAAQEDVNAWVSVMRKSFSAVIDIDATLTKLREKLPTMATETQDRP